jgi:hypothetical protein
MIPRKVYAVILAAIPPLWIPEYGFVGALAVGCAILGAYGLGAESSTSPPTADDLEEWS